MALSILIPLWKGHQSLADKIQFHFSPTHIDTFQHFICPTKLTLSCVFSVVTMIFRVEACTYIITQCWGSTSRNQEPQRGTKFNMKPCCAVLKPSLTRADSNYHITSLDFWPHKISNVLKLTSQIYLCGKWYCECSPTEIKYLSLNLWLNTLNNWQQTSGIAHSVFEPAIPENIFFLILANKFEMCVCFVSLLHA